MAVDVGRLLDDRHVEARRRLRPGQLGGLGRALGQGREVPLDPLDESRLRAASHAHPDRPATIVALVEGLHVVEGDRLQALDGPPVDVAVGVALVELDLQGPLAQLLVVIAPEGLRHVVERLVAEPLEVLGGEPGRGDHGGRQRARTRARLSRWTSPEKTVTSLRQAPESDAAIG